MLYHFSSRFLIAASLLLGSSLASVHAAEVSTKSTPKGTDDVVVSGSVEDMFDALEGRLATAIAERIAGDQALLTDLNTRATALTNRLNTVEAGINTLDARFNQVRTLLRADIDARRAEINTLRGDINANVADVLNRINQTYGYINANVLALQNQINTQNSYVSDLNTRVTGITNSVASLEAFANTLNGYIESLATCVANTSCLNNRQINFQPYDITIYTGEAIAAGVGSYDQCISWFLWWCTGYGPVYYTIYQYGTKPLGIYYPTWQYCAITGAENQDVRDFRIFLSGSQWTLRNETIGDSGAANQQEGTVYARCIRFW